jgi:hypothetical protein
VIAVARVAAEFPGKPAAVFALEDASSFEMMVAEMGSVELDDVPLGEVGMLIEEAADPGRLQEGVRAAASAAPASTGGAARREGPSLLGTGRGEACLAVLGVPSPGRGRRSFLPNGLLRDAVQMRDESFSPPRGERYERGRNRRRQRPARRVGIDSGLS